MKKQKSLLAHPLVYGLKLHKLKIFVLGIVVAFSCMSFMVLFENGPDPAYTGSPSDGQDCTSCHSDYTVNTGSGVASITTTIPGGGYVAGNTYSITATINYTTSNAFGFELSPQTVAGAQLGTLHNISTSETQIKTLAGVGYIEQTSTSNTGTNTRSWTFTWTAPVTGSGCVHFYAAFVARDGLVNNAPGGDYVYTKVLTVCEAGPLSSTIAAPTNASCYNVCNGKATVNAAGGTPPYTYLWNCGLSTSAVTALCAGTHTVVVTDAVLATATSTVTITQPTAVTATTVPTNVLCHGGNGSATVTAVGGTSPYVYSWNSGSSTSAATLAAGSYTVTVTDAHSCTKTASVTITQPTALTTSMTSTPDTLSSSDGTVTVIPAGGTAPYTYVWATTPAQSSQTATGLAAGMYTVTVTDGNGCSTAGNVAVGLFTATTYIDFQPSVRAYPNPGIEDIFVEINSFSSEEYALIVMDVTGKIVYKETMQLSKGKNIKTISLAAESEGVFFIQLRSPNGAVKVIPIAKVK